jgi:gamma-glutamyltranspeptidase/glutathione hydrolase
VRAGGIIARGDLEEIRPQVGPPITVRIGDRMIATQPPISQGVVLLRALSLFAAQLANERGDIGRLWPRAARSLRTAFAERFAALGDTADSFELAQAMAEGRLANAPRGSIELANAGTETTTISAVDNEGNAAALILSIFADFGSGIVTEETGILLNNRLTGFFLDEKHPNGLAPRKRAMHTLHSVMVLDGDSPVLAGGTPGADAQPQVNLQVLSRVLFRGQDLGAACAEPRWMISPVARPAGQSSAIDVQCEPDLDAGTRAAFEREGFSTKLMTRPDIGSAKWVMRQGRELVSACDTRRDAAVAAE